MRHSVACKAKDRLTLEQKIEIIALQETKSQTFLANKFHTWQVAMEAVEEAQGAKGGDATLWAGERESAQTRAASPQSSWGLRDSEALKGH